MANEGDAVALIAGVALAGDGRGGAGRAVAMMQNSGLGNAVSPLTSLTWTFGLPQLLIVTWRGQPGVPDEPQHALMGPITPAMLETMEIPWELFPTEAAQIVPALERALAHMDATGRPYALLMQKGSVATTELRVEPRAVVAQVRGSPGPRATQRRDAAAATVARSGTARGGRAHDAGQTVLLASTGFLRAGAVRRGRPRQPSVHGGLDGLRDAAGAGPGAGATRPEGDRAGWRRRGADAAGGARDRGRLRAAQFLAPVAGQRRARLHRRPGHGLGERGLRSGRRRMRLPLLPGHRFARAAGRLA